jgi:alcohol dehydrogenase (NADP+)
LVDPCGWQVGVPPEPFSLRGGDVIFKRLSVAGSLIGGIRETQEMLDFCGRHNITATIELIPSTYVNKVMCSVRTLYVAPCPCDF